MERLSKIIQKIYQKYLPELSKKGVNFNLDFPDTTIDIPKDSSIEKNLEKVLKAAIKRTPNGSIMISVRPTKIMVKDTGEPLSKTACDAIKNDDISVKSRVGFGTEVVIKF